ncbi:putative DD34D transposase [Trichonephila clavipes]|nr:putative DD34D transposase [Trichonephila clavipes]
MFKEGRESVEDDSHAGHPSSSRTADNKQHVRHLLNTDRRLSVCMIAEQPGMDKMVVHKIISEDLAMRKICAKLVPKVLTDVQKQNRETYDPETKRQSSEWHTPQSPRQKKARMSKSRMKAMLIVFFDKNGVVHSEFVPEGQTVNGTFYVEVLKRLKRRVNRVRPKISANWKLHHDNAPSHPCFVVTEHLTKNGIVTIPQPPYSSDLSPADFLLFPKMKTALKGCHHGTLDNNKRACTHALKVFRLVTSGARTKLGNVACRSVFMLKEHIWKTTKEL